MITALLVSLALQSVATDAREVETCRLIRTILTEVEQQNPGRDIVIDTHFRGASIEIDLDEFVFGRHTRCVGRCDLRAIIAWHEAFNAAPIHQIRDAFGSIVEAGSEIECERRDGEQWSDAERTIARYDMVMELADMDNHAVVTDPPIIISISPPAFDFDRQTALFMESCRLVFYSRNDDGAWQPLARSIMPLCEMPF
ncbi:hypothetical protein V0U79_12980 [Hyphobacterium sp. HN65]|uniref:Uncharacterized protein n=1 Tax=Hyphobacterium lacteum TaxID=3116575 RepID=A0ABU7LTN7_9PROT|nr:hypothetical protein [Hyphobacterium sp. HN65]MEE2527273.1 hypothetical protein [Hyphobacterium sp. HN65]